MTYGDSMNYYQILGVSRTASAHEIKNAYRKLVVLYHPDRNPDPVAHEMIKAINEAYDVLGDPEKRKSYDFTTSQSWRDLVEEPPRPVHRDPAYRRRKPSQQRPPSPSQDYSQVELMVKFMPYTRWFSRVGLFITVLLLIDLVLPFKSSEETVYKIRNSPYCVVETYRGRNIKIYDGEDASLVLSERVIKLQSTVFFSIPMIVSDLAETKIAWLGYIYKNFVFMPISLFLSSALGIYFTHRRRLFSFNLSISSALLLILNLYLILTQ